MNAEGPYQHLLETKQEDPMTDIRTQCDGQLPPTLALTNEWSPRPQLPHITHPPETMEELDL